MHGVEIEILKPNQHKILWSKKKFKMHEIMLYNIKATHKTIMEIKVFKIFGTKSQNEFKNT
jgi:hypothetical protein